MKGYMTSACLAFALASHAAQTAVNSPERWQKEIKELGLQAHDMQSQLTLAQAKVRLERLATLYTDDPAGPEYPVQWRACSLYVDLVKAQLRTASLKNHKDSVQMARFAVQKDIVSIQRKIIDIEAGKASSLAADLEQQKQKMVQTSAASAEEQERLRKEAAARELALQQELADKQRLLEEERRKAEERQDDARKKLDALQSKLINVHKDARGIILSMSDILFDVNKASLTPDLKTSLAKIAGILSVYSESNVIVEGHTDNTGSAELNQKLSEQRAGNVLQFLVEQGVAAERLRSEGFGFSKPIGDNATPEGRQKNRRVDLVIQDKNLK